MSVDVALIWIKDNWFYLTLLGGFAAAVYKFTPKLNNAVKVIDSLPVEMGKLQDDIDALKTAQSELKEALQECESRRLEGVERTELLMRASKASLEALHDGKANGNVTGALEALDEYMRKKASA